MNDLLSQIHPLTKGIVWLSQNPVDSNTPFYKEIDYLLNGLLTAKLNNSTFNGNQVFVSENFGKTFYVLISSEVGSPEMRSFMTLLSPQLMTENDIAVIDEIEGFNKMMDVSNKEMKSKFRLIKQ